MHFNYSDSLFQMLSRLVVPNDVQTISIWSWVNQQAEGPLGLFRWSVQILKSHHCFDRTLSNVLLLQIDRIDGILLWLWLLRGFAFQSPWKMNNLPGWLCLFIFSLMLLSVTFLALFLLHVFLPWILFGLFLVLCFKTPNHSY